MKHTDLQLLPYVFWNVGTHTSRLTHYASEPFVFSLYFLTTWIVLHVCMSISLYITITVVSQYRLLVWFSQISQHLYFDHTHKQKKYESSIMFLCEAGKIKTSKLEFYDLKPSEFKDLKKITCQLVESCA